MKFFVIIIFFSFLFISCSHTYYVVRHAEKAELTDSASRNMQNDLPLSEAGKVRAIVLRSLLEKKNIRYIFSTTTARTLSTAEPLRELKGLQVEKYSTDTLDKFISRLKEIKKGNVLIVGHSNTVDNIVNKLVGSTKLPADLKDAEYDNLFIIKYKGKKISYEKMKYGYASNP